MESLLIGRLSRGDGKCRGNLMRHGPKIKKINRAGDVAHWSTAQYPKHQTVLGVGSGVTRRGVVTGSPGGAGLEDTGEAKTSTAQSL